MKKSEVNQLMELIECLVSRELKKQLPSIINEVKGHIIKEAATPQPHKNHSDDAEIDLKTSLKELFSGASPVQKTQPVVAETKRYMKDPVLNQLLNETRPDIRARDTGMSPIAAYIDQYKLSQPQIQPITGMGEMMETGADMGFLHNIPTMQQSTVQSQQPIRELTQPVISNNQISLPEGTSVKDVAPMINPVLGKIFNRNYSDTLKAMDKAAKALRPM